MPLTKFKKGFDPHRNMKGRPKKNLCIGDVLRKIGGEKVPPEILAKLKERFPDMLKDERYLDALCRVIYNAGLKGESWAVQVVFDRVFGKVKDQVELTTTTPMVVFPGGKGKAEA